MWQLRDSLLITSILLSSQFLDPLLAQECQPELLGSSLVGRAGDIEIVGSTAFVAQYSRAPRGGGGVQVVDVSDPESPTTIGFVATPGTANGIAVAGRLAYVADGEAGLAVIDIGDPRAPEIAALVPTTGRAYGIRIASGLAYVTVQVTWGETFLSRLEIFDLTDPQSPQPVGSTEIPGRTLGLWVSESRAYVADWDVGLIVVDVESPEAPRALRTIETPEGARNACVSGGLAFVANGKSGLTIIDVQSVDDPVLTTVELPHVAHDVDVSEGVAYVTCRLSGLGFGRPGLLEILDVSDPASAQIIGTHDTPGPGIGLRIVENRAYVGAWNGGMRILDVEDPAQPREVGSVESPGSVRTVAISRGKALVGGDRLSVIDIEDPERLSIPRIIEAPGVEYIQSMALSGDLACAVTHGTQETGSELHVIDFSDPQAPQVLGSTALPDYGWSATAVSDGFAYVASWGDSRRLFIVDVSDPEEPALVSSISTSGFARDVAVSGGVAYVAASEGGLRVIDVRDAENPRVIDSLLRSSPGAGPETFVETVAISGDYAYVGLGDDTISVVDVADPRDSRVVATVSVSIPGGSRQIVVDGERAYVVYGGGLSVLDIEDPERPRALGNFESPCGGEALAIGGGYAYIASQSCGLQVIDISSCQPSPNLFRRGDCNEDDRVDLSDAVCILGWLFLGEEEPGCVAGTDTNADAVVDLSDAVWLLGYLFLGGPAPAEPFLECGPVPAGEDGVLTCRSPSSRCVR